MRLARIHDFVAAIEAGSIGAAARKLGVSQPALTKSLRALEAQLEVPLLQRTARGVLPTRYGKALYARARSAQSELERAEQELQALAGDRGGSVAFGFGPVAASRIVPEAVSEFRRQYPDASVRLVEGFVHNLVPGVLDESLDFAIGPGLAELRGRPGLRFKPLFHYERAIAARRQHPLAKAGSLARLGDAQWLSFEPSGTLEKMFDALGLPVPRPVVQCESGTASLRLIATTDMLGIVPEPMLSTESQLRRLEVKESLPPFTVGVFTRFDAPLTRWSAAMVRIVTAIGRRVAAERR